MRLQQTNAHTRGCVRILMCVCIACIGSVVAVEFDTTGHPLKEELPEGVKRIVMSSVKSHLHHFKKDSTFEKKYGFIWTGDTSQLHITGVIKLYKPRLTKKAPTKNTPVENFITRQDSGFVIWVNYKEILIGRLYVSQDKGLTRDYHYYQGRFGYGEDGYGMKEIMEEIVNDWSPSEGYHPVFIQAGPRWFFHVPEVDSYNLTPISPKMASVTRWPSSRKGLAELEFTRLKRHRSFFHNKRLRKGLMHIEKIREELIREKGAHDEKKQ